MHQALRKFKNNRGFTMIEIISVFVIIGIISAFAIARMNSTQEIDRASQVEVIKGHLRIAQARAMSAGEPFGINFNTTTSYFMFRNSAPSTALLLPGENNSTVSLSTKKSSLVISSAPRVVTYDAYGSPGNANISINTNGGNFSITKNTGFIK